VFISYVHSEALDYATDAKMVFAECGYRTWVWHFDHAAIGTARMEMIKNIEASDYFLDIATAGSRESHGQEFERKEALARNKPILIFAFEKEYISEVWIGDDPLIYIDVSQETFAPACRKVAQSLLRTKPTEEKTEDNLVEPS
jgi:hypothetical protein